jgi:hypothetical protein
LQPFILGLQHSAVAGRVKELRTSEPTDRFFLSILQDLICLIFPFFCNLYFCDPPVEAVSTGNGGGECTHFWITAKVSLILVLATISRIVKDIGKYNHLLFLHIIGIVNKRRPI